MNVLEILRNEQRDEIDPAGKAAIERCIQRLETIQMTGYLGDLHRTTYVVEGDHAFPFDMLRYVQSWPADESSSFHMNESVFARRVTLSTYHRDPEKDLERDRWRSKFHWQVVDVIDTVAL